MSYFADHLAWQQRVAQEFKASSHFLERQMTAPTDPTLAGTNELYSYMQGVPKSAYDLRRSFNQPMSAYKYAQFNTNNVAPGTVPAMFDLEASKNQLNMTGIITKKDLIRERSQTAASGKNRDKKGQGNPYSYMGKSKVTVGPKRSQTQSKANFKPSKEGVQQEQHMPRFNEEIETKSFRGKTIQGGPKSTISVQSKGSKMSYNRPQTSSNKNQLQQANSGINKQKILEAMDRLSEKDLEKVGKMLKVDDRSPNEGYEGENQMGIQTEEDQFANENEEIDGELERALTIDEGMSKVSKGSKISQIPRSEISKLTNKTYISHLESQLKEERQARKKLESELEELKRISSEISSHLGLNKR